MKNEKSGSTKNNKKLNKKTATGTTPAAAINNTTGASQKVRAKAGRGLNNEGTNVSYTGEDHDG
jgi:hypothetical protein